MFTQPRTQHTAREVNKSARSIGERKNGSLVEKVPFHAEGRETTWKRIFKKQQRERDDHKLGERGKPAA